MARPIRSKRKVSQVEPEPPRNGAGIPVVGIGASAGGIGALETLVPLFAPDAGLAYVVVQHLDPTHESVLTALLARAAKIPVVEIKDQTSIQADHVYVIPPNTAVTVADGRLRLTPPVEPRGQRTPIDGFFVSLAEARGESAAAIVLSGTGSDGTIGLRAVKEHGGLTVAQDDAEYDGMMRSAVRSGMVDFVLPIEKIPAKLYDYFRHLIEVDGRKGPDGVRQEATANLAHISTLLRARTGHDFSGYKDKTVARRVQRRMQVLQIDEVPDFIERLRKEPQQLDALLQDLLIGVTNFFRDPQAFEALEREVIPQLFEGKGPEDALRVWVPGCSTGEEAYSIAILLREHMPKAQSAPKLQIFASDIDEHSLQIARIGRFPATIAKDVPPARLERYFVREDGTYRIASDLREICLFSAHNLLRDAPFSKLDLIACRNLLIYLTPELQNRVIPLFHYALNDGGFLFLGTSENVTRHPRLFSTVDKGYRIFRRRPLIERRLPEFPLTSPEEGRRQGASAPRMGIPQEPLQTLAERQLLDRYSPAYVVVNSDGELLHGSARTGKYLELAPGAPRNDIYGMARPGLKPDLRAGVHKAVSTGQVAIQRGVTIGTNGGRQSIDLIIHPIRNSAMPDSLYMVVFQDVGGIKQAGAAEGGESVEELENANLRQLEMDLRATRERLQTTTEELESSNEELKSGNEELSSMNEELQSANEELETSKEELQSINEELQTVNAELNSRVEELSRANSDIANLLESTQIATVFLDRNLSIKSFTPAAKDVFRLVESDTGRPLTHVRARFNSDTVQEDAERVLRTLSTIERQVESNHSDARYVMRMMPYRTVDNVIGGVVITFVDITRITAAEARIDELTVDLRNRVQSLETLLSLLPVGILIIEDDRSDRVRINRYGAQLLGESADGGDGAGLRPAPAALRVFQGERELRPEQQPLYRAAHSGEAVPAFAAHILRTNGAKVEVMMSATPMLDAQGKVRGGIVAILDITERRAAEAHQQILLHELQHRVKNIITTIAALASRMMKDSASLDDFSPAFLGRLRAMAATHELLSHGNWTGARLRALIEGALQSHLGKESTAVTLVGPDLILTPGAASTLGLVFYELATNATKYGSLSGDGRVAIAWRVDPATSGDTVVIDWDESGGPPVNGPIEEGFGTGFVKRSIEYEMSGTATLQLNGAGLRWTMAFPLQRNVQQKGQ
ncbi:two-component system, chemotaxis family, CheB/CheR fusion protein [Rhodospirillales bacterium URHD0017]|nr:two-component system, chemotaxis family, CheB/CheR fusion protein [Rhodospirillales bacterium URHD0017]